MSTSDFPWPLKKIIDFNDLFVFYNNIESKGIYTLKM